MKTSRRIRFFVFGQHFADGVRVTLEIIIPAIVFAFLGLLETGIYISLGALCISICDAPGPVRHKRNGMFYGIICVFLMAILTGLLNYNPIILGLLIMVSTFFFSLLSIYGARAASIGTAALLVMALTLFDKAPPQEALINSALVLAGGIWYMGIALAFFLITPYRQAQRALGDCLAETARYLEIKSQLYHPEVDTGKAFSALLSKQLEVSNAQDTVRELLFKSRSTLKESTVQSRLLVITFAAAVNLFEQIMASWYDFDSLRKKYSNTDILSKISGMIKELALALHDIADAMHSDRKYRKELHLIPRLEMLGKEIDNITEGPIDFTIRRILINLRNLGNNIETISKYFSGEKPTTPSLGEKNYSRFVSHQKINRKMLQNNLSMDSSAFRHALRVMITCTAGYLLSLLIFKGDHSYWIIMTIIIILKPGYSLTKSKNFDRLTGTIGGGVIGLALLAMTTDDSVLFGFLIFFMLGTYTFVRMNYVVMVVFLTPYVLILFHFLRMDFVNIAGERLVDTAIASVLAFLASKYLFPKWEFEGIQKHLETMLKANFEYLNVLKNIAGQQSISTVQSKLIRKKVFVNTANLSAALHRMLSEPKSKQMHQQEIHEMVVFNHILSSNIAALSELWMSDKPRLNQKQEGLLIKALDQLKDTILLFDPEFQYAAELNNNLQSREGDETLKEPLEFINKMTDGIYRMSKKIAPKQQTTLQEAVN